METNKLRVLECSGTPYEIGRQYGENRATSIRKASELFFGGLLHGPFKASKDEVKAKALKTYLNSTRSFDPGSLDMVECPAEGAGVDFDEAFALQCSIEVSLNYQHLMAMCTSFAVTGEATQDGTIILGQNIDWHPEAPVDLLRIRHEDGLERFSLCLSGNGYFHLTSVSMENCANLTLGPLRVLVSRVPLTFYLSKAMRQETIEDALGVLRPTARGSGTTTWRSPRKHVWHRKRTRRPRDPAAGGHARSCQPLRNREVQRGRLDPSCSALYVHSRSQAAGADRGTLRAAYS